MNQALETFSNYIYLDLNESEGLWRGMLRNYLTISPICTETIDCILSDTQTSIQDLKMASSFSSNHNLGDFKFYDNTLKKPWYKYIKLIKKRGQFNLNGHSQDYFVLIYTIFTSNLALKFLLTLFSINKPEMRVTRLIKSNSTNILKWYTLKCGIPIYSQQQVCDTIMSHWLSTPYFNTKVIISGSSGVGKLSIGKLLKRRLEFEQPDFKDETFVELFDDVDLSLPGINIKTHILGRARKETPVIITVKNIEKYYEQVLFDTRVLEQTCPIDNKSTFKDMLDSISNRKYVIIIFTTNLTKFQLKNFNSVSQECLSPDLTLP